ncbi:NAD(P)H-binding protein [Phytoactinopolyspora limicola]|uniref:NAD(P)H-binding protein n=1 Tax=Phytoactinopolyspora limicola TaxID=2715536 RepID=UPI0014082354|nr:NAD(P)H-binding protein [Phytoactinopolyspora limicola]
MTEPTFLVLGATGKIGQRVTARLRELDVKVRGASRSSTPPFDWTNQNTWDTTLLEASAVFVVPHDGTQLTRPFIRRAVDLGVERVVLLSGRGVDVPGYASTQGEAGTTHIDGEAAVRTSGIDWTILRPTWFAQNFSEGFFRDAIVRGELRLPTGDGAVSFVDAEDIAAVAVAALTGDGHTGQTYELSGPRALTMASAAAEITAATGLKISYVDLSPDEFIGELVEEGWPLADAEGFADVLGAVRRGLDRHISDGVRRALGREPRDFTEFVRAAATR